jgi:hypothetical protein
MESQLEKRFFVVASLLDIRYCSVLKHDHSEARSTITVGRLKLIGASSTSDMVKPKEFCRALQIKHISNLLRARREILEENGLAAATYSSSDRVK